MRKAILIFAHKDPEYLNLFAKQLLHETNGNTDIFFHIDKNNNYIAKDIELGDNVLLIENNIPIKWGNDSMVKAMVNCFNEIVDRGKEYDYFLILTGQDIMVKKGLDEFLEEGKDKIYIDARLANKSQIAALKHRFPAFMCSNLGSKRNPLRIIRGIYMRIIINHLIPNKKIDFNTKQLIFWYSFNWSAMPYNVLQYIVHYINESKGFLDLYKDTYLPEDLFLGTIIMNSKYDRDVVLLENGKTKTLTYWKGFYNGARMVELGIEDIPNIEASGCFFARKAERKDFIKYYFDKMSLL